jgi:hypothetical protein
MKQRWFLIASLAVSIPFVTRWYAGPPVVQPEPLPLPPLCRETPEGNVVWFEGLMFEKREGIWYDVMTGEQARPVKVGSRWQVGPRTMDGEMLLQIKARQAWRNALLTFF